MGCYIAIVDLLEELQQHLSPNNLVFRSSAPFTKREIQFLHDAVTSVDSLLTDSLALTYSHDFITQISEKRIVSLARKAGSYLDLWVHHMHCVCLYVCVDFSALKCLSRLLEQTADYLNDTRNMIRIKAIREGPNLAEITQEMIAIKQDLNKIHQSSSTGKNNISTVHTLHFSSFNLEYVREFG